MKEKEKTKGKEERRHEGIATELSSSRPHCLDVGEDATTPSRTSLDWMSNTGCRVWWISQRVSLKDSEEKLSSGVANRSISRGFRASAPHMQGVQSVSGMGDPAFLTTEGRSFCLGKHQHSCVHALWEDGSLCIACWSRCPLEDVEHIEVANLDEKLPKSAIKQHVTRKVTLPSRALTLSPFSLHHLHSRFPHSRSPIVPLPSHNCLLMDALPHVGWFSSSH
jgi:hypothetical protein